MFETVKSIRVSDQIASQIRRLILESKIKPGDRLAKETELAAKFGVSRASVREALSVLESEGIVERRKNGGTFFRKYSLNKVLDSFEFPRKLDHEVFEDLVEVREKLELQIVELAAKRATELDILRLERTLELMQEDIETGGNGIEADILFHQCLAVATQNQVLAGVAQSIGRVMQETRILTLRVPGRLEECFEEHKAIYRAVCNRDVEQGCQLIKEHLLRVRLILAEIETAKKGEE